MTPEKVLTPIAIGAIHLFGGEHRN